MNQLTSLSIVLLLATISLVHGKWLLKTTASNCSAVPWSIYAENGNCARISYDKYQKITCDGNTAITYECSTSGCTSCKQVQTTELNTCDSFGMTVQCFDQEPPYPKYVGPKFVTDNIYSEYNCAGDRLAVYAYSLDTCVNIYGPASYSLSCKNNTIMYYQYNTADCSSKPYSQFPDAIEGVCGIGHLWRCF
jgi:hypothetical protein